MSSENLPGMTRTTTTAPCFPEYTLDQILAAYFDMVPDPENPSHRVSFGTSGHRGSSMAGSFNEQHILAITQAICDYRKAHGVFGPLFMGKDTHALSAPALDTALEVLAANEVETRIQSAGHPTPTPVVSHAILTHNHSLGRNRSLVADGILITPSHNPPEDGGVKYNTSCGGPAGTDVTAWIEERANALLSSGNREVRRISLGAALQADCVREIDFIMPYVRALDQVVNMEAIGRSGLHLGVDPLGGASLPFWEPVADLYGIDLTVVNKTLDPMFRFMPPDHDGKIRMDCSSPYAMAGLITMADTFSLAFANDPDADRHGIVTPAGLMNPNHYLCAAISYLIQHRPGWPKKGAVGKTCVSTSLIDRVCASLGKKVYETPVGFKWFVDGLYRNSLLFGGEERAGASFLCKDGTAWSTDKDGIILNLLAAEMTAVIESDPAQIYARLSNDFGPAYYDRTDAPATPAQKKAFQGLTPAAVTQKEFAGAPIDQVLTTAPGNQEPIGGLKVTTADGWFAARPSGTEDLYKIYAESFVSQAHLRQLQDEARELVAGLFASGS